MKIIAILGSPRSSGNSATLAEKILDSAKEAGADTKSFKIGKSEFKGCVACMACKKKADKCVINDDLTKAIDAVEKADALIIASPVYFGELNAQTKAFIDRMYGYLKADFTTNPEPSRLKPGKKLVFVLAQGDPNAALYAEVYDKYAGFLSWFGFECQLLRAVGVMDKDDASKRKDLMKQAEAIGKALAG